MKSYRYLLIGGGISADTACRAIRELDQEGSIGMVAEEPDPPYNRPPLSKGLWKGQPIEQIWRGTETLEIDLHLGRKAIKLDAAAHQVLDDHGEIYNYTKLLLATGGSPIRLPGAGSDAVLYFRTLADYRRLREICQYAMRFAVLGGGFIGSEIGAVLAEQGKQVSLLFMEEGVCARLFPPQASAYLNQYFTGKGVQVLPGRRVERIETTTNGLKVHTAQGDSLQVDAVVAGLGIRPNLELAIQAGLETGNGIRVDPTMRTSNRDIFACGDAVSFYSSFYKKTLRVEHEDHANQSGRVAGMNMAGSSAVYDPIPSYYSTVFDLNYDAVGELDPSAGIFADWIDPYRQGTIYYLKENRIQGILLWNISGRLEAVRQLVKAGAPVNPQDLAGRIQPLPLSAPRRILRVVRKEPPSGE